MTSIQASAMMRRLAYRAPHLRTFLATQSPAQSYTQILYQRSYSSTLHQSSLPTVTQTSFWTSLLPKFLRRKDSSSSATTSSTTRSKDWNPATFFIVIFLLIGSQAIRMIALRHEHKNFTLKTNARIAALKEVVEKLQRGEEVDVEKVLGTGDPTRELEWEDVLKEIEKEDSLYKERQRQAATPAVETKQSQAAPADSSQSDSTVRTKPLRRPGFY